MLRIPLPRTGCPRFETDVLSCTTRVGEGRGETGGMEPRLATICLISVEEGHPEQMQEARRRRRDKLSRLHRSRF